MWFSVFFCLVSRFMFFMYLIRVWLLLFGRVVLGE